MAGMREHVDNCPYRVQETEEAAEDLDVDDYSLDKLLEDKLKREENDRNDDDSKSEIHFIDMTGDDGGDDDEGCSSHQQESLDEDEARAQAEKAVKNCAEMKQNIESLLSPEPSEEDYGNVTIKVILDTLSPKSSKGNKSSQRELSKSLVELANELSSQLLERDPISIPVRRESEHFLDDAFQYCRRKKFNPYRRIKIDFVGESAIDTGGPLREFWRLLAEGIYQFMCHGAPNRRSPMINTAMILKRRFFFAGRLMAMSLAHGGSGFPFFSSFVFQYFRGFSCTEIALTPDDIPHFGARKLASDIQDAHDDESLQTLFRDNDNLDIMCATGCLRPLGDAKLTWRKELVQCLKLYYCLTSVQAALDQIKEGLETFGVLDVIRQYPDSMSAFFCYDENNVITSEKLAALFSEGDVTYTDRNEDETTWNRERSAYMLFMQFLDDCEDEAPPYDSLSRDHSAEGDVTVPTRAVINAGSQYMLIPFDVTDCPCVQ
ncbi:G2/M phase-specific E3 ubiquitin-protein ligase-like [Oscarella lobularis]|uniref:G2/M phase-specific E3 ubiquitin-protein ligase-like n=1 Tax=Oscarella lobularis TaxID=121494 RepID=UPI0033135468